GSDQRLERAQPKERDTGREHSGLRAGQRARAWRLFEAAAVGCARRVAGGQPRAQSRVRALRTPTALQPATLHTLRIFADRQVRIPANCRAKASINSASTASTAIGGQARRKTWPTVPPPTT